MRVLDSPAPTADIDLGAGVRYETWSSWQRFKFLYLSDDGRIVDASTSRQVTTSTGQSYALFFALVANDRPAFDAILLWTLRNLADGSLEKSRPARQWGQADDGTWRVLDADAQSGADLWFAYALGEAARLWREPRYAKLGLAVARNIVAEEVATVAGLGTVLLPGPEGFVTEHHWRLNPSYLPLPAIRGLARQTGESVWTEIAQSSERIILGAAPNGFAADWIEFTQDGFVADRTSRGVGSHDAIRVYLWAGMLPASEPMREPLATALKPMLNSIAKQSVVAETVDSQSLEMHGEGSPGFSAALLPSLANARMSAALQTHRKRAAEESLQSNQNYYSDALTLFGLGWLEQRYRFNRAGLLNVRWTLAADRPH
jgi:endo-1,4-beta-D-glucanase Y